jgi:hypothetical protein
LPCVARFGFSRTISIHPDLPILFILVACNVSGGKETEMDFSELLELTVLAAIAIELFSLYWYSRFYHKIEDRVREAVDRHLEKSNALIKILDEHINKLDIHTSKLDEHIKIYEEHMSKLDAHLMPEEK